MHNDFESGKVAAVAFEVRGQVAVEASASDRVRVWSGARDGQRDGMRTGRSGTAAGLRAQMAKKGGDVDISGICLNPVLAILVDGEPEVYLRVCRCAAGGATGGLGWRNFRFDFRICSAS